MIPLKSCPFCNTKPCVHFDHISCKYVIQCEYCIQKGISLSCEADNMEALFETWNDRWFDNKLLLKKDKYLEFIDGYYYNLALKEHSTEVVSELEDKARHPDQDFVLTANFGHLILEDCRVLDCLIYSHPEVILELFGINNYKSNSFDHRKFCMKHGIIKITSNNGEISVDIPDRFNKDQITKLFEVLTTADYVKNTVRFSLYVSKLDKYYLFYNMNDLLLEISKL